MRRQTIDSTVPVSEIPTARPVAPKWLCVEPCIHGRHACHPRCTRSRHLRIRLCTSSCCEGKLLSDQGRLESPGPHTPPCCGPWDTCPEAPSLDQS